MQGIKRRDSDPENKKKRGVVSKKLWEDPEYRERVAKAVMRPEVRQHRSEISKAQWADPEKRGAMLAAKETPECKAKSKEARSRPEYQEALRNARKKRFEDPAYHEKLSAVYTEVFSDPVYRKKRSELAKAQWADPEKRAKMCAGIKESWSDPAAREAQVAAIREAARSPTRLAQLSGANNPAWKGGISFEPYCPKFNKDLKRRVRAYFENRCMACGKTTEENQKLLACHHVEYNKSACCDGEPVHFAALCQSCHARTNHNRARWEAMLHIIIDEIYGGRSYFTRDEWTKLSD